MIISTLNNVQIIYNMRTKGDKTREAILEAAVSLLDKADGFSQVQIRDIARAAGVSDGSPHYYFGSKDNLVNEAIYSLADRWLQWWFQFNDNIELPAEQRIRLLVKHLGNYYAAHPNVVKISLQNDLFMNFKDSVRERFVMEVLMPLARAAIPRKSDEDIKAVAYTLSDAFDFAFLRALSKHPDNSFDFFHKPSRDRYIDRLIDYSIKLLTS